MIRRPSSDVQTANATAVLANLKAINVRKKNSKLKRFSQMLKCNLCQTNNLRARDTTIAGAFCCMCATTLCSQSSLALYMFCNCKFTLEAFKPWPIVVYHFSIRVLCLCAMCTRNRSNSQTKRNVLLIVYFYALHVHLSPLLIFHNNKFILVVRVLSRRLISLIVFRLAIDHWLTLCDALFRHSTNSFIFCLNLNFIRRKKSRTAMFTVWTKHTQRFNLHSIVRTIWTKIFTFLLWAPKLPINLSTFECWNTITHLRRAVFSSENPTSIVSHNCLSSLSIGYSSLTIININSPKAHDWLDGWGNWIVDK